MSGNSSSHCGDSWEYFHPFPMTGLLHLIHTFLTTQACTNLQYEWELAKSYEQSKKDLFRFLFMWNEKFSDRLSKMIGNQKFSDRLSEILIENFWFHIVHRIESTKGIHIYVNEGIRKFLIASGFLIPFLINIMFINTYMIGTVYKS